jgi:nucleoside-diphosphate-sugar epimerase
VRVLISGAGGFIGRHLAVALARRHHDVIALVRRQAWPAILNDQERLRIKCADLAKSDALPRAPLDAIVHCAAAIPASVPDESELFRINVEGTRRLFTHALSLGTRTIIFCSSMAAYGRITTQMVTPDTPVQEPGIYGRSKLEGERLLEDVCDADYKLRAVSIRLPGVVGPGSHDNFVSDTMARLINGQPVNARNPDAPFNNIVHIDDFSAFVATLLETLPPGHRIATMAAADPLPIREVIGIMKATVGAEAVVDYRQEGGSFLISNDYANTLGYRPATVRDSVQRFAHAFAGGGWA